MEALPEDISLSLFFAFAKNPFATSTSFAGEGIPSYGLGGISILGVCSSRETHCTFGILPMPRQAFDLRHAAALQ
jgi:hypothetical protein